MIISNQFLSGICSVYKAELMSIPYAKQIAKWCLVYFQKYGRAPKKHIQDIYETHARKGLPEEQADMIGDFLTSISREYQKGDKFNVQYSLDQAEEYFKNRSFEILKEDLDSALSLNNLQEAETLVSRFKHVKRQTDDGINPFTDKEVMVQAFEQEVNPLFTIPGALGDLMNDQLQRGNFLSIMAPEKRGKTWWLMELAKRAYKARCNVAFFGLGDMSRNQMQRRFGMMVAGKSWQPKHCGRIIIPCLDCERNQTDKCHKKYRKNRIGLDGVEKFDEAPDNYRPCTRCMGKPLNRYKGAIWYEERGPVIPLTWRESIRASKHFASRSAGKRDFKLVCVPAKSMNIADIRARLDIWEDTEGFVPGVIVLDYMDILAPEPGTSKEDRGKINDNWMMARALSLERNCLIITATQTDTDSYTRDLIGPDNFSEDKRKYAHVTGVLALNQTEEEKMAGLMRIGWVFLRESDYDRRRTVKVIQCLQVGKPCIASYW
jgi:hypothetical protein